MPKPEEKRTYKLKLSPQQQAEIRELTGKDAETLQLTVMELEERLRQAYG